MVIVRAPVRISFGGGGTDIPAYYTQHGGFVVSTAITRYATVMAYARHDGQIRFCSADYGLRETFPQGQIPRVAEPLSLPKAAVARFSRYGLDRTGIDLLTASEVPPGTGLGSSSAMAVALVRALAAYLDIPVDTGTIAEVACSLEIEYLGMPIGKQDQYASAFGGLNAIEFSTSGVSVTPLPVSIRALRELESRLMLFSTGIRRESSKVLSQQQANMRANPDVVDSLHRIKRHAYAMCDRLCAGDLDGFGNLLHECWLEKRRLTNGVSSRAIDDWYTAARSAGAQGGKITGAGGGGHLLIYAPPERQTAVRDALLAYGLEETPFRFDRTGVALLGTAEHESPRHPVPYSGATTGSPAGEEVRYASRH